MRQVRRCSPSGGQTVILTGFQWQKLLDLGHRVMVFTNSLLTRCVDTPLNIGIEHLLHAAVELITVALLPRPGHWPLHFHRHF